MGSFDVTDMNDALNNSAVHEPAAQQGQMNPDAAAAARQKGWSAPQGYDYSKYNSTVQPLEKPAEEEVVEIDLPEWAAKAAKYEWKDEFGDVGPHNPELEKMLFRNDFINRTGMKLGK